MNRLLTTSFFLAVASTASASVTHRVKSDNYPRYAYKYAVYDPKTRDIKDHWEAREGDLVKGAYSLVEPDGKLRVVDYWADDAHGFNADVKRENANWRPIYKEPAPVVEVIPIAKAAPAEPKAEVPVVVAAVPAAVEPEVAQGPAEGPLIQDLVKPLTSPVNYGFGSGGDGPPLGQLYTSLDGTGSLRWDSDTGSYGGWVPLRRKKITHATIFNKKYIDGKLHKWAIGPISLVGRTLVFKVKH